MPQVQAVYYATLYRQQESTLGIVTIITSLGKVYYGLKHSAGFVSVTNLVKASKSKKKDAEVAVGRNHVQIAQTST